MFSISLLALGAKCSCFRRRPALVPSPFSLCLLFVAAFTFLLHPPSIHAQDFASLKGEVTDASGAPVPSASVKARNVETGALRAAMTDDAGRYLLLALPVG